MSNNNNQQQQDNKVSAKHLGDFVLFKQLIGEGAFAKVYKGQRKSDKLPVAIKILPKLKIDNNLKLKSSLEKEITILRRKEIDKRYIIELFAVHKSKNNYYLVMEYCQGGDLASYLRFKKTLPPHIVQRFLSHIAKGLKSLRDINIVHRDLKPQNLLLTTNDDNAFLKIADFGFAREIEPENMAATFCGSPLYMAPEVIDGEKYNEKADLWSVGVILYEMFTGATPFMAFNLVQLSKQIKEKNVVYPATIPKDAVNLLTGLLQREPLKRISFQQFFEHPFIRDFMRDDLDAKNSLQSVPQQQQQPVPVSPRIANIQIEQVPPKLSSSPPSGNAMSKAIPIRKSNNNNDDIYGDLNYAAHSLEQTPPSFQMSMSPASMRAMIAAKQPKTSPFNNGNTIENSFSPPSDKYFFTKQSGGKIHVAPAPQTNVSTSEDSNGTEIVKTSLKHLITISENGTPRFAPVIFDFSKFATGAFETRDMNEIVKFECYGKQAWAVAEAAYYYEKCKQLVEALSLYIKSMQLLQTILSEIKNYFHVDVSIIEFASVHSNGKNAFVVEAPERLAALVTWTRNCYATFMKRCEKIRNRLEDSSADAMSLCTPEALLFNYAIKLGRDSGFEEYTADMTNCLAMCGRGKLVFEYLLNHSELATEQADKDSLVKYVFLFQNRLNVLKKNQKASG